MYILYSVSTQRSIAQRLKYIVSSSCKIHIYQNWDTQSAQEIHFIPRDRYDDYPEARYRVSTWSTVFREASFLLPGSFLQQQVRRNPKFHPQRES